MKIMVTGATGLVGSALVGSLVADGHEVTRLVRRTQSARPAGVSDAVWNPSAGTIDAAALERHDAAVHLAGETIAERWTEEKKRRIRESRVKGTRLLAETLAKLAAPPSALVCASAIGYYGSRRGDELLTEESAPGDDFLAGVCREWEAAAEPARAAGIRTVHLRLGVVLSARGGALAKMLTPFKMGAGGRIGSGKQYMSWVALSDVVRIIKLAMTDEQMRGPVNTVAPTPVRNEEFTKTLGRVLSRPTLFPLPAFVVRLAFGEMGEATLLASQRVAPARLQAVGYQFSYPQLEAALRDELR